MDADFPILISIIICTHRRPDSLSHVLASLKNQTWRGGGWEVLVVENDTKSSSDVAEIISEFKSRLPIQHCIENIPNLSRARNLGAKMAQGKYLAYLDDDAEARDGWLEALVKGLKEFLPDFCGGPSYPLFRSPKPSWFREAYAIEYVFGDKPRALKYAEWIGGMNFIVQRDVVFSLGGFREDLGMAGGKIAYGEETCLLMDGWKNNPDLKIMYFPSVAVNHEIRPVKMTMWWNVKSWWACGRDSALMNLYGNGVWGNIKLILAHSVRISVRMFAILPILIRDLVDPGIQRYKRYICDTMKSHVFWMSYGVYSLLIKINGQQGK